MTPPSLRGEGRFRAFAPLAIVSGMTARRSIEALFRAEYGRVLAAVLRTTRDFSRAEDAVGEALIAALRRWPESGIPERPAAWLTTVARRAAIDGHRRAQTATAAAPLLRAQASAEALAGQDEPDQRLDGETAIPDDRLRLIFTCCHPAINQEARIALTLQAVCGLPAQEIARLLRVRPATMSQRLVRAKHKIKASGIAYEIPPPHRWAERLESVLAVVYLLFTEGYAATRGALLLRPELTSEAIYLGELLAELIDEEPEVLALLALMRLHDARQGARLGPGGELLPLAEQDRSRWDRGAIDDGLALLHRALELAGAPGSYQIQAAIAALHVEAESASTTDWAQIAGLYAKLREHSPSPVVDLNYAVTVAMLEGPRAGLDRLRELEDELRDYHRFYAVRGELLARLGRPSEAYAALTQAIALARNGAEEEHLSRRRALLGPSTAG